ncbi:MAG: ComF family protein [Alphaproteobacteria bacterium]|nr:ComF family protein [Alphaproteobacteria bacterium]
MTLWQKLLNILLPPRCIKCGKILSEKNGLCPECFNSVNFISEPYCHKCGRPFVKEANLKFASKQYCGNCLQQKKFLFDLQRSAFIYDDVSKDLILDLKFRDKTISAEALANMLYMAGKDIWEQNPDLIIPVPIHRLRLIKRRFNQSALLVKYLSLKTNIQADYSSLTRKRNTIPQVQLSGLTRRKNLRQAFSVKYPHNIKGKKIVLIDDVETTGSTLHECAKVLRKAGAEKLYSVTLARAET